MASLSSEANSLLTPYSMGRFELSHLVVLAPLTRCRALGTVPQPAAVTYYSQRATKGGFMLSEATVVSEDGHGYPNTPGIYTEEQIEAWKPIVKAVKEKGAIFFSQIWHVGRASHQDYQPNGALPIGPSSLPITDGNKVYTSKGPQDFPLCRELETDEIPRLANDYAKAAEEAINVGFDGVEIHADNGYLIDQFLKDGCNHRTDKYGGSVENRARFALEVVDAVIAKIGADRLGLRLSPFGGFLSAEDSDPYAVNLFLMEELNKRDLLYVHMVEPRIGGITLRDAGSRSLDPFRKAFRNTFIASGGYTRENGMEAIKSQHADLVAYGRLFLANPDLPKRFELNAPFNKYDRDTFYSPEQVIGYTDYPFLKDTTKDAA